MNYLICFVLLSFVADAYANCWVDLLSVGDSMGGTMGGVLQIFFSAGEACLSSSKLAVNSEGGERGGDGVGAAWCRAFVAGVEGVEFYGGAKAGMRTVLDAIVPAAEILQNKGQSGGCFSGGVLRGRRGCNHIMHGRCP